jgi:glutathionylspermidine synthase
MLRSELVHILKQVSPNFQYYPKLHEKLNASLWFKTKQGMDHEFVCAIPDRDIPEYSRINKFTDEAIERGWKAIFAVIEAKTLKNGKPMVDKDHFWHILHKNGIWSLDSHPQEVDVSYSWKWSGR